MNNYSWRIVTALRHWSAALHGPHIRCELCESHATFSSSLVNLDAVVQEVHWHCDIHTTVICEHLEAVRMDGLRWIIYERHWMHRWKVGYVRCSTCHSNSEWVGTLVDQIGNESDQIMFCKLHVPPKRYWDITKTRSDDVFTNLKYGLGASIDKSFLFEDDENEEPTSSDSDNNEE